MFSLSTVIIACLITLVAGGIAGYLLAGRGANPQRNSELEQRLTDTEDKLHSYQRDVTEHFAETAELVHNLTENYRAMHEHLVNSALKLTTPEISRQLLGNLKTSLPGNSDQEAQLHAEYVEAPRDWAPKRHGSKGTLSEDFGLSDTDAHPVVPEAPTEQTEKTS